MSSKSGETQKITSKTDDVRMSNIIAAKGTSSFERVFGGLHVSRYTYTLKNKLLTGALFLYIYVYL